MDDFKDKVSRGNYTRNGGNNQYININLKMFVDSLPEGKFTGNFKMKEAVTIDYLSRICYTVTNHTPGGVYD